MTFYYQPFKRLNLFKMVLLPTTMNQNKATIIITFFWSEFTILIQSPFLGNVSACLVNKSYRIKIIFLCHNAMVI